MSYNVTNEVYKLDRIDVDELEKKLWLGVMYRVLAQGLCSCVESYGAGVVFFTHNFLEIFSGWIHLYFSNAYDVWYFSYWYDCVWYASMM